jgi:hypothetical protein
MELKLDEIKFDEPGREKIEMIIMLTIEEKGLDFTLALLEDCLLLAAEKSPAFSKIVDQLYESIVSKRQRAKFVNRNNSLKKPQ